MLAADHTTTTDDDERHRRLSKDNISWRSSRTKPADEGAGLIINANHDKVTKIFLLQNAAVQTNKAFQLYSTGLT